MEKEYSCVDEVFAESILEDVSDDVMQDDSIGIAMDLLDDNDYDDGDLIDILM